MSVPAAGRMRGIVLALIRAPSSGRARRPARGGQAWMRPAKDRAGAARGRCDSHYIPKNYRSMTTIRSRPALSFGARLVLLFGVLAAALLTVGVRVWQTADRSTEAMRWAAHAYAVKDALAAIVSRYDALQADAMAYAATGDPLRLNGFDGQTPVLDANLATLAQLLADDPDQARRASEMAAVLHSQLAVIVKLVDTRRSSGSLPELPDLATSRVSALARGMLAEEDRLLVERRIAVEHAATMTRLLTTVAISLSLVFLFGTFVFVFLVHRRNTTANVELRDANAQIGAALAETRRIGDSMHKLGQLGEMLQSCREIDEVRAGLGAALSDLLPRLGGRLALINPSQNLAAIAAHWGRHTLLAESVFAPEDCWALRRGQAYPLAGSNAGFVCKHVHWPNADDPAASYLCVPLAAQGEIVGVLTFDGPDAPTAAERRLALAAGEQLALALANLRLQQTLRTQSIRDPLTGLFNRRYLEVSLERELLRAARRSQPLAVLMLDVDHFKRFNDSHGHDAGDALLSGFAEVLQRTVRSEDIACRYGGEEFTIVMLEADAALAARSAEQIRAAVAAMSVEHRREQLPHVTVSIGLAAYPRDGRGAEELLRRADAALYRAKNDGRDRVVVAEFQSPEREAEPARTG